jgi:hypothetical protein
MLQYRERRLGGGDERNLRCGCSHTRQQVRRGEEPEERVTTTVEMKTMINLENLRSYCVAATMQRVAIRQTAKV